MKLSIPLLCFCFQLSAAVQSVCWMPSPDTTNYIVLQWIGDPSDGPLMPQSFNVIGTNFVASNLLAGSNYRFGVYAVQQDSNGMAIAWSDVAWLQTPLYWPVTNQSVSWIGTCTNISFSDDLLRWYSLGPFSGTSAVFSCTGVPSEFFKVIGTNGNILPSNIQPQR